MRFIPVELRQCRNGRPGFNVRPRLVAFEELARAALAGEFDINGRPQVLKLDPQLGPQRLTRDRLHDVVTYNYDNANGRSEYLPYCWIPLALAKRWFEKNRIELVPTIEPATVPSRPGPPTRKKLMRNLLQSLLHDQTFSTKRDAY